MHAVCCLGSAAGHSGGRIPGPLSLCEDASDPASSGASLPEQALVTAAKKKSEEGRWWRIPRTLSKPRAPSARLSSKVILQCRVSHAVPTATAMDAPGPPFHRISRMPAAA